MEQVENILKVTKNTPRARLWPLLVGNTGTGKSARVSKMAEKTGKKMITLLLGTMLAEDVLGLPQVSGGVTIFSAPKWVQEASNEPVILFLDELDKARPDVVSSVLTLLSDLSARGWKLHSETMIIAAAQPKDNEEWLGDETSKALLARCVPIAVGDDWQYVATSLGLAASSLSWCPERPIKAPQLPDLTPRAVTWCYGAYKILGKDAALPLIKLVIPLDYADELVSSFERQQQIDPQNFTKVMVANPALVDELDQATFVAAYPLMLRDGSPQLLEKCIIRMWGTCDKNTIESAQKELYRLVANGNKVTLCGRDDVGQVACKDIEDALQRAASVVYGMYEAREEGGKQ